MPGQPPAFTVLLMSGIDQAAAWVDARRTTLEATADRAARLAATAASLVRQLEVSAAPDTHWEGQSINTRVLVILQHVSCQHAYDIQHKMSFRHVSPVLHWQQYIASLMLYSAVLCSHIMPALAAAASVSAPPSLCCVGTADARTPGLSWRTLRLGGLTGSQRPRSSGHRWATGVQPTGLHTLHTTCPPKPGRMHAPLITCRAAALPVGVCPILDYQAAGMCRIVSLV
jgi:hypothetical protein